MWNKISSLILRNRILLLVFIVLATLFMLYEAMQVQVSYKMSQLLPKKDSVRIEYERFKRIFGDDGNLFVIGIKSKKIFKLDIFNKWYDLGKEIEKMDGAVDVVSIAHCFNLKKNSKYKKFEIVPLFPNKPKNQHQLDSIINILYKLPFYKGFLYNDSSKANLMFITVNKSILNTKARLKFLDNLEKICSKFSKNTGIEIYFSGLPYIRTKIAKKVQDELKLFLVLAIIITALILYLFFRSFKATFFSLLVVVTAVIWSMGFMTLLGFKITLLTALIPPLMIVIGIPNSIFLLNKYHSEYKLHFNQIKSLQRVIQKIGNATFMTNLTTACGLGTFVFTRSEILRDFGIIASISVMAIFIISLLLIPIIFSFLPAPSNRHTKHLDKKWLDSFTNILVHIVSNKRLIIYLITVLIVVIAFIGIFKIKITGKFTDDIPKHDKVFTDLKFFESNFGGIMPFEIIIDTKKKNGIRKISTLKKIEKAQKILNEYPQFSKSISIVDGIKFIRQAYYNGSVNKYGLIKAREQGFLTPYLNNAKDNKKLLKSFVDSSKQLTRISVHVKDLGIDKMDKMLNNLKQEINKIFDVSKYNIIYTGTLLTYVKGTTYLTNNLFISLAIAISFISLLMSFLFSSARMVVVSLIPNIIPLIITAGVMGYFNISFKPSTILIFSIAFGISVDNTIHFLTKYRHDLKKFDNHIGTAVKSALKETGISMIYTSIVLFFGFCIFAASSFGGTKALGILVSLTLFVAMFSNLVLLPSLLLSLERKLLTKAFREPLLEILEEDEDIDLDLLTIKKENNGTNEKVNKET